MLRSQINGQRSALRIAALSTVSALALSTSGVLDGARADCTPSATAGINFDCSGESSNSAAVVNHGTNPVITGDNGNMAFSLAPGSVFTNSGVITVDMNTALNNTTGLIGFQRTRLYGISGADAGSYDVTNTAGGLITVTHNGVGRLWGIAGNGDATNISVTNAGTVSVVRGNIALGTVSATSLTAHGFDAGNAALGNQSLDVGASAYTEEELESMSVTNTGTLSATGLLAAGVYSRAGEAEITNSGTIRTTTLNTGFAIAAVSDSGETRSLTLENSGTISGAILAVGGQAQRWFALSEGMGGTVDSRLSINSQYGELDSEITNSGTIARSAGTTVIYYGNGAHTLTNEDGGTITGNINVDQRIQTITGRSCNTGGSGTLCVPNLTSASVGQVLAGDPTAEEASEHSSAIVTAVTGVAPNVTSVTYTESIWGAKSFTFENAGTMTGDVTIVTQGATTVNGVAVQDSTVTFKPHLFGGGSTNKDDYVVGAQAAINGTLTVKDNIANGNVATGTSSLARTTSIAPVIDGLVRNGEWYTVATTLNDTGANAQLTAVQGSALVNWTADVNASNALVIGATVADASSISGLSQPGTVTLNGLLTTTSTDPALLALAGAVQNLATAEEVRKAAEQLAPDTSRGTLQSAILLASLQGAAIEQRLGTGVGGSAGGSASAFAAPSGLGMGSEQTGEPPMHLSSRPENDGSVVYGNGREAAWAQAFAARSDQESRAGVAGYGADLYGFTAGYDGAINASNRLGVAVGYGQTRIADTGDRTGNHTDMTSYSVTAYGISRFAGLYASGRAGFTWHDLDTLRGVTVGGIADTATGTHGATQVTVAGEIGAPMHFGFATLTPVASVMFNSFDQDAYTERSTGGVALAVSSQNTQSILSGLGAKAVIPLTAGTTFEGRAIWLHELGDRSQDVTAAFAAGGPSFTATGPAVSADSANIGAGLSFNTGAGYSLQINYDAFLREDNTAQTGSGRVRVQF